MARNEPAGIRTHDRKRTGVKRPDLDTKINTYLTKLIFVGDDLDGENMGEHTGGSVFSRRTWC